MLPWGVLPKQTRREANTGSKERSYHKKCSEFCYQTIEPGKPQQHTQRQSAKCNKVMARDTTANSTKAAKLEADNGTEAEEAADSAGSGSGTLQLDADYNPGENDVMCGRGKTCFSHVGNKRFRQFVSELLDEYSSASTKVDKSLILSKVVKHVRNSTPRGGFIKKDPSTGRWYDVGDFLAREKTSQAFRDALHDRYRSSNKSKKRRRQAEQAKASEKLSKIARTQLEISSKIEKLSADVGKAESDSQVDLLFNQTNSEILRILNQVSQSEGQATYDASASDGDGDGSLNFGTFHPVPSVAATLPESQIGLQVPMSVPSGPLTEAPAYPQRYETEYSRTEYPEVPFVRWVTEERINPRMASRERNSTERDEAPAFTKLSLIDS